MRNSEPLEEFLNDRPFRPFAIHLADGRAVSVRHPEMARFSRASHVVEAQNEDDLTEVIDLLLITSLRPLPPERA